jgi:hypothetical protein
VITFDLSPQGTEPWLQIRSGKITGSKFKIARERMKKTGDLSAKATLYARDVARERFGGKCESVYQNHAMRFGTEQEPFARQAYETTTGALVQEAGFAYTDCGMFGLSVDGLVGDDGVIEIKTMVGSDNLFETVVLEDYSEYMDQCLGYLLFLDRQWVDLVLWTPDLEDKGLGLVIHRISRADHLEAIDALRADLNGFAAIVKAYEAKLRAKAAANVDLLAQAA